MQRLPGTITLNGGRFINADTLLGKTGVLLSHNIFAYCINNPVNRIDPTGRSSVFAEFADDPSFSELAAIPFVTQQQFYDIHGNNGKVPGRMIFPNGAIINVTVDPPENAEYHIDVWMQSAIDSNGDLILGKDQLKNILRNLGSPYVYGSWKTPVPIILEVDYDPKNPTRTWAVVNSVPHNEVCVYVVGSRQPSTASKKKYDQNVKNAPAVFLSWILMGIVGALKKLVKG